MDEGRNDEIKTLLRKNLEFAKENNRILKKMRRSAVIGNILRLVWWAFLLGLPVILYYYFLQPYVGQFVETYQGLQSGVENVKNIGNQLPDLPGLNWLLNRE